MLATDLIGSIMEYANIVNQCNVDTNVRICVGNYLYDIDNISTSINMDTNKQDIIVYVKDK